MYFFFHPFKQGTVFFFKKYQKTQKFQVHNFIIQFHRKSNKNCYAMISNNVIISSVQSDRRESLGKSGSVPGVAGDKGISDFSPKVFFQGNKADVNLRAFVLYFSLPRLPSLLCASDSIMLLAPFIHLAFFFFFFSVSVSQAPLLGVGNAQVKQPKQVLDPTLTKCHRMQAADN